MAVMRVWSADEKREIIAEYETAVYGTKRSVLVKFGVSDHQIRDWRGARDAGLLDAGMNLRNPRKTPKLENAEIVRLRAEVERLQGELDRARQDVADRQKAVEALGKATALLHELVTGKSSEAVSTEEPSERPVSPSSAS